jgi:hypothetical protein
MKGGKITEQTEKRDRKNFRPLPYFRLFRNLFFIPSEQLR